MIWIFIPIIIIAIIWRIASNPRINAYKTRKEQEKTNKELAELKKLLAEKQSKDELDSDKK